MSVKSVNKAHFCDLFSSFLLIVIIFTSIYFVPCGAVSSSETVLSRSPIAHKYRNYNRLVKRDIGKRCLNSTDCESEMHGSVCVLNKCMCPQGFLPNKQGILVCLRIGKKLGNSCTVSEQCGDDLDCRNHVCQCREGFHLYQSPGTNMCLLWHKPTRILERCILTDGCSHYDVNSVCKKRWCQCKNGYQMFETMLFGRKQRCFKTFQSRCDNDNQCSKLAETPEQFCQCSYGLCHCLGDLNSTLLAIPNWSSHPNWYQRWRKDLILATRLLFITVILFFVPCFVYVTLGVRQRSRQLFSQIVQPSRVPPVHYSQRRPSNLRPLRSYRGIPDGGTRILSPGETHHVELSLHANGINSRLVVENPSRRVGICENRDRDSIIDLKEEDPPPSYDEIMRKENNPEAPPPPYRDL